MENYPPDEIECIRKYEKMTQEEKNQWHVHMFRGAVRFSDQESQMRKK